MGTLLLFQLGLDLGLIALMTILLIERTKAKHGEDPRLSRGLQMLTSKIAIVQDLMDRTEIATKQCSQLLEGKQQDVQESLENVERHLHKINESIERSKKIARLFQDKIPHEEIIERQNSQKYLKAAKLANQGASVDEIAAQVNIPRGELELIVKLNRHDLVTPHGSTWMEEDDINMQPITANSETPMPSDTATEKENPVTSALTSAAAAATAFREEPAKTEQKIQVIQTSMASAVAVPKQTTIYSSQNLSGQRMQTIQNPPDGPMVRPVVFKRITTDRNT